ncbi:hypothetical protein PSAC2689_210015 [Paraburkholderia sacchari]
MEARARLLHTPRAPDSRPTPALHFFLKFPQKGLDRSYRHARISFSAARQAQQQVVSDTLPRWRNW